MASFRSDRRHQPYRREARPAPASHDSGARGRPHSAPLLSASEVLAVLVRAGTRSTPALDRLLREEPRTLALFRSAVTTRAADPLDNMELLELIGDSVVNCAVVAEIVRHEPSLLDTSPGIVYRIMNEITSTAPLAKAARRVGLDRLIRGNAEPKTLEDCFEAWSGALAMASQLAATEEEGDQLLVGAESFVLSALAPQVEAQLTTTRAATDAGRLVAAYTKASERANHVLAVGQDRQYRIVDGAGWAAVRELDAQGKPRPGDVLVARGRDKQAARDALNLAILEQPELFGATRLDADTMGHTGGAVYVDTPLTQHDRERAEHVALLLAELPDTAERARADEGVLTLRTAFTDPRVDPARRGNGFFNMFGDRLLKLFGVLEYLPRRFPLMAHCSAVADVSSSMSRLSQCRPTLARRLGLVRFTEVSAKAFHLGANGGGGSSNRSYNDVVGSSFSAMLAAVVYLESERFTAPAFLPRALWMMRVFLEPVLDSVDFTTMDRSFALGGKAAVADLSNEGPAVNRAALEERPETATHRRALAARTQTATGLGVNKAEAQDDLGDKILAALLGHPFRASLDPGIGFPEARARLL